MTEASTEAEVIRLGLADLDAVEAIEKESYPRPWSRESLQNELSALPHSRVWGIRADSGLLGYAVVWVISDEAHLANIAVTGTARRRGIGRRLIEASLQDATRRGARVIFLEVRASNAAARLLYAAAGFAEFGIRPRYYDDNHEDAVVMRRDL